MQLKQNAIYISFLVSVWPKLQIRSIHNDCTLPRWIGFCRLISSKKLYGFLQKKFILQTWPILEVSFINEDTIAFLAQNTNKLATIF